MKLITAIVRKDENILEVSFVIEDEYLKNKDEHFYERLETYFDAWKKTMSDKNKEVVAITVIDFKNKDYRIMKPDITLEELKQYI